MFHLGKKLFFDEKTALENVPTLKMMLKKPEQITKQAKQLSSKLKKALPDTEIATEPGFSQTGSGSLPTQNLPTTLVTIKQKNMAAESLAKELRLYKIPIFTRIRDDRIMLDPRTLLDGDEKIITEALTALLKT